MADEQILSKLQEDALREVANIGSGHAATSLSELLNKRVMIRVPQCLSGSLEDVILRVRDPNEIVASVLVDFIGDLSGRALVLYPFSDAKRLMKHLMSHDSQAIHDVRESLLKEVTNIIFCSYINALGELLGFLILPSVPGMTVDLAGAVLQTVLRGYEVQQDMLFCIETEFWLDEEQDTFKAFLLLMPDVMSLNTILRELKLTR